MDFYYSDYENEPIGGGNPYYRCIHCKRSDPEINGRLEGHSPDCVYRQAKEQGLKYSPFGIEGDDALVPKADLEYHMVIVGHSGTGKSMLDRLSDSQRQACFQWMNEHPGVNGMEWPGWADLVLAPEKE